MSILSVSHRHRLFVFWMMVWLVVVSFGLFSQRHTESFLSLFPLFVLNGVCARVFRDSDTARPSTLRSFSLGFIFLLILYTLFLIVFFYTNMMYPYTSTRFFGTLFLSFVLTFFVLWGLLTALFSIEPESSSLPIPPWLNVLSLMIVGLNVLVGVVFFLSLRSRMLRKYREREEEQRRREEEQRRRVEEQRRREDILSIFLLPPEEEQFFGSSPIPNTSSSPDVM